MKMVQQNTVTPKFTWLKFFNEMLSVICSQYDKRSLKILFDDFNFGHYKENEFIDPLTFIAFFNLGSIERRKTLCAKAKQLMNLREDAPQDFDGIPTFDPRNPVFFRTYTNDFDETCLETLWEFAQEVNIDELSSHLFDECLSLNGIGIVKLSQFLFIVKPDKIYPCDFYTREFLGVEIEKNDWEGFVNFQKECRTRTSNMKPYLVSYQAWVGKNNKKDEQKAHQEDDIYITQTSNYSTINKPNLNEDFLNRKRYAIALANLIKNKQTKTPLNIGICASWGEGKSHLIGLLKEQLKQKSKIFQKDIVFVDFDAWQYDNQENIWASMLMAIVKKCQEDKKQSIGFYFKYLYHQILKISWIEKAVIFFLLFVTIMLLEYVCLDKTNPWAVLLISLIGTIVPITLKYGAFNINTNFIECLKMPSYQECLGFKNGIEEIVNFSLKHLSKNGEKRIVLFVDNLDRCSKENITEILDAISKFLNMCNSYLKDAGCSEIVSILAIDYQIIEDAVVEIKKIDSKRCDEYLDKIINFPFFVPKIDDISSLLNKYLNVEKEIEQEEVLKENEIIKISSENSFSTSEFNEENIEETKIVEDNDKPLLTLEEKKMFVETFNFFQKEYRFAPRYLEKMINMYIVFKSVVQIKNFEYKKLVWWFAFALKMERIVDKDDIESVRKFLKEKPQFNYEFLENIDSNPPYFVQSDEFEELFKESAIFLKPLKKEKQ